MAQSNSTPIYTLATPPPLLAVRYSMDQPDLESVPSLRVASSSEDLRQDNQSSSSQSSGGVPRTPKPSSAQELEIVSDFVMTDDVHLKPSTRATWRAEYIWDTLDNPRAAQHDLLFELDM
jgi:hypothetical protein